MIWKCRRDTLLVSLLIAVLVRACVCHVFQLNLRTKRTNDVEVEEAEQKKKRVSNGSPTVWRLKLANTKLRQACPQSQIHAIRAARCCYSVFFFHFLFLHSFYVNNYILFHRYRLLLAAADWLFCGRLSVEMCTFIVLMYHIVFSFPHFEMKSLSHHRKLKTVGIQ